MGLKFKEVKFGNSGIFEPDTTAILVSIRSQCLERKSKKGEFETLDFSSRRNDNQSSLSRQFLTNVPRI